MLPVQSLPADAHLERAWEGGRRREKEGEGGRRREKEGEGGRRREKEGEGGRRREKEGLHRLRGQPHPHNTSTVFMYGPRQGPGAVVLPDISYLGCIFLPNLGPAV
jgi:hypothetical protein